MPVEFEKTSFAELQKLPRNQTVFFFSVGTMEDHGPHLPLGTDLIEARELCVQAAKRLESDLAGWKGVIMPTLPFGVDGNTTQAALTVRGYVLRDALVDSCTPLARMGFQQFVCFSGNLGPRHLTAIEEVHRMLRRQVCGIWPLSIFSSKSPVFVSANSALVDQSTALKSPLWPDAAEHGGRKDTAMVLAFEKSQVGDYEKLKSVSKSGGFFSRMVKRSRGKVSGYWGSPSEATAAEGARALSQKLDDVWVSLRAVWKGGKPENYFRSTYIFFPSNKSFFKAWLLSFAVFVVLLLWIMITVGSITKDF
ncbi:creatininase family protein [bacterium]|nr:creatininase family protein [bacterium]